MKYATISNFIRQGAKKLQNLHGRLAKSKAARSGLNIGLVVIMGLIILSFAQTGTLTTPTKMPLTMNGKQVGSTTLPAGTEVTILKEDPATGKVLVKARAGETWVEAGQVEKVPENAIDKTPSPNPSREVNQIAEAKPKEVNPELFNPFVGSRKPCKLVVIVGGRTQKETGVLTIDEQVMQGIVVACDISNKIPILWQSDAKLEKWPKEATQHPENVSLIILTNPTLETIDLLTKGWRRVAFSHIVAENWRKTIGTPPKSPALGHLVPIGEEGKIVIRNGIAVMDWTGGLKERKKSERFQKGLTQGRLTGDQGKLIKELWKYLTE